MDTNASGKTKRDWLAFDRVDYLTTKIVLGIAMVGSVVLGIAMVGSVVLGLGRLVVDATTNAPLAVSYTTKVTSGFELPRGATHDDNATMRLQDATLGERLGQALPELLLTAMTIAAAWLIFQLLRSTQAREPFTKQNVKRINAIALIVGLGGMLVQLAQGFANNAIHSTGRLPDPSGLPFVMTFTPLPLVVLLVIALVGETFRRGIVLRHDVEGLV